MNFKPFLAYSASAGSGKTFALAIRYLSLLFLDEEPKNILAATFANKAASEMKSRIVSFLNDMSDNKLLLDTISHETGLTHKELIDKQPEILKKFLSQSCHIITLDSLFASILRSSSLELEINPDFAMKNESHEDFEKLFLSTLKKENGLPSLVSLAMDIEDKKFTRIFELMNELYHVDPLLPNEKKDSELSLEEAEKEVKIIQSDIIDNLSSLGAAARSIGQFESSNIKSLYEKKLFEKTSLAEHSWFKKGIDGNTEILFSQLKDALKAWGYAKEARIINSLLDSYDSFKNGLILTAKNTSTLSFDDLTYFTYRLLHESISKEYLYFKLDAKFKHILLDEFQDTSILQFLILKPMIDEIFSGAGQNEFRSFFYVGDTKQSLYRFRGSLEELFGKVAENYGMKIEQLNTNYRSSKHIVSCVNKWFINTMPGYVEQESIENASSGYVKVHTSEDIITSTMDEVVNFSSNGVSFDDVAILVSTNRDGQEVYEHLKNLNIPAMLKTSSFLHTIPNIAALVSMVKYLYYKEDIDMYPFLDRVGISSESFIQEWFSPDMSPDDVIHFLVSKYHYYGNDINILKLLQFASTFQTIPDFLEEFRTSSIPIGEGQSKGVKIMTVHSSKGLEFKHVIVMDRTTRAMPDSSATIMEHDDSLNIDEIFLRMSGRERIDEKYAQALFERKTKSEKDKMNVLYVALTRSEESLIILKKEKDSFFSKLELEDFILS